MRLKTRADAADAADNEVGLVAPKSSANRKSSFNGGEGLKSEKFTTKIFLRKLPERQRRRGVWAANYNKSNNDRKKRL